MPRSETPRIVFLVVLSVAFYVIPVTAQMSWKKLAPNSNRPGYRGCYAMAFDAARQRVVLFGGYYCTTFPCRGAAFLNDTWEWDHNSWSNVTASTGSPPARAKHAMAYDATRGQVVLFGGSYRNDTWEWDGKNWSQKNPLQNPIGREEHALVFDSTRRRIVLFGGRSSVNTNLVLGDTWEWDGTNWIQKHPATSPPGRMGHAMAYDATRQRVVLFGGGDVSRSVSFSDTWEWDGITWTQRLPASSPSQRWVASMAFDAARQRIVLVGGEDSVFRAFSDTWEWDGKNWNPAAQSHLFAFKYKAMAFDTVSGSMVLFNSDPWHGNETWAYAPCDLVASAYVVSIGSGGSSQFNLDA